MELVAAAVFGSAGSAVLAKLFSQSRSPSESAINVALEKLDLSRLLRRLAHEDGLGTIERASDAIREYKLFLRLVWQNPEENLLPSAAVDAVWQRHLLDTQAYHADCLALFGVHMHRIYETRQTDEVLVRTRALYQTAYGTPPSNDLWSGTATVPAVASVSPKLLPPPQKLKAATVAAVEDEDLEWLGVAVAKELPLKQAVCKKSEPLRKIAIADPAATVAEYKKFLRMMVDNKGAWLTPSKLVDELWHRHMLDTVAYCQFCERVNGGYLHHTPHYGKPHSYHDPGFMATLKAYENKFASTPPKSIWGTVGESGGCGGGGGGCGGGGCGAGGGGGATGQGGGEAAGLCACVVPLVFMWFFTSFIPGIIKSGAHAACVEKMPSACGDTAVDACCDCKDASASQVICQCVADEPTCMEFGDACTRFDDCIDGKATGPIIFLIVLGFGGCLLTIGCFAQANRETNTKPPAGKAVRQARAMPGVTLQIVAEAIVRSGPSTTSQIVGKLSPGERVVAVAEEREEDGHQRVCIGDGRWISRVTRRGNVLAQLSQPEEPIATESASAVATPVAVSINPLDDATTATPTVVDATTVATTKSTVNPAIVTQDVGGTSTVGTSAQKKESAKSVPLD